MLHYEKLLTDTLNVLKELYRFIDVKISDKELHALVEKSSFKKIPMELKGKGKVFRNASPGKWKENLSEKEQKLMNSLMGDTLKELNYDY